MAGQKNETTRESPRQYLEKIVDFEVFPTPTHPSDNDIPPNFDRGLLSPSLKVIWLLLWQAWNLTLSLT